MSAEAVSAAGAVAVVAEIAVAVVVEIAAERTVEEGTKARLKTWYGSERPCVGERNWASVEALDDLWGGKAQGRKKRTGEGEDRCLRATRGQHVSIETCKDEV